VRIFLTGGTGYIGSAVLDAVLKAGHETTALVRTPAKAQMVQAKGGHPIVGDLGDPSTYRAGAVGCDAYIHTADDHSARRTEIDRMTVETLISAARDRAEGSVFIYTSGVWVLGNTSEPAGEAAAVNPTPHVAWRPGHEQIVLAAGGNGLRTVVVRPGIVYGSGSGMIGDLFRNACNGLIRVIGDGDNHWPLVYDRDLANLYLRLATTSGASGVYHATDESDERVNEIVEDIAGHVPVRPDVRHVPIDEARTKLGALADAMALNQIVRCPRARSLGWSPTLRSVVGNVPGLLEEWGAARR
jgi:nucleoside-diphosphate-sugar epimerase